MADETTIDWSAVGDTEQPASVGPENIDWSAIGESPVEQPSIVGAIAKIIGMHSPSEDVANEASAARKKGIGEFANHVTGGLTQLANNATFGLEPKLNAGLLSLLSGKPYDQAQQEVNAQDAQYAEENPATAGQASYAGKAIPAALLAALFPNMLGRTIATGVGGVMGLGKDVVHGAARGFGAEQVLGRDKSSSLMGMLSAGQ